MRWVVIAAALGVCGGLALWVRTDQNLPDEKAIEQRVYELDIKTDDGSKIVVEKGSLLSYEITYAVTPGSWISDLKAIVEGGLGAPKYQGVIHMSNGQFRVGGGHQRIVISADRAGPATVTITYKQGRDELKRKVFNVEVQ